MPNFIKLTRDSGATSLINLDNVTNFYSEFGKCHVEFTKGHVIRVEQSLSTILNAVSYVDLSNKKQPT